MIEKIVENIRNWKKDVTSLAVIGTILLGAIYFFPSYDFGVHGKYKSGELQSIEATYKPSRLRKIRSGVLERTHIQAEVSISGKTSGVIGALIYQSAFDEDGQSTVPDIENLLARAGIIGYASLPDKPDTYYGVVPLDMLSAAQSRAINISYQLFPSGSIDDKDSTNDKLEFGPTPNDLQRFADNLAKKVQNETMKNYENEKFH